MTRWIRSLNFSTKMAVIAVAAVVPVVVLTVLFLAAKQQGIDVASRELAGMHRSQSLESMLLPLGMHEVLGIAVASGENLTDKLQAATADVTREVGAQDSVTENYGAPAGEDSRRWNEVKYSWNALAMAKPGSVAEVTRLHAQLRQSILDYRDYIATMSGLALDGDPVGSFIIDASVTQIPTYEAYLTQMRAQAVAIAAAGKASMADVQEIERTEVLALNALDAIDTDIRHAAEGGTSGEGMRAVSEQAMAQAHNTFESFRKYLHQSVIGLSSDALDVVTQNGAQLGTAIGGVHASMQQAAQKRLQASADSIRATRNHMLLLVVSAMLFGLGSLGLVLITQVRGLNETVAVVSRLAEGDYTHEITVVGSDELARSMRAVQIMQSKLSGVLSGVKESSLTVATAARQINAGTSDLSARTEQQAANLEETASSMEAMTSTVKQNADNAKLANKLAQAARTQAEQGGLIVERAVAAMGAIDVASKKIADIISVIDEIAFQTNLLALNAAVEAARAGDQGRGFAVVASEVRSLAQRSASAAREIKDLIHDSVSKVGEGSKLVSESGHHLGEIVASVKKVSDVVGEISNASQEQAASAEEISRAVMQMDQSTQQNAAMVEQASAAAASMNDQAARLSQLTSFFKLREAYSGVPGHAEFIAPAPASAATAAAAPVTPASASGANKPGANARPDRRGGSRPWTKTTSAPAEPARASAAGSGSDWSEF
ncbi:MAG TPA: methyl-accepting chemotaxis protein [Steroidobacteraceae bacterium]|jgi:methyl-accepting chemotaxis protein